MNYMKSGFRTVRFERENKIQGSKYVKLSRKFLGVTFVELTSTHINVYQLMIFNVLCHLDYDVRSLVYNTWHA